jgi:hypothetical protein
MVCPLDSKNLRNFSRMSCTDITGCGLGIGDFAVAVA